MIVAQSTQQWIIILLNNEMVWFDCYSINEHFSYFACEQNVWLNLIHWKEKLTKKISENAFNNDLNWINEFDLLINNNYYHMCTNLITSYVNIYD